VQNDGIFRDYYHAWDWLQARWAEAEPYLTSAAAIRIYVGLAGLLLITFSLYAAYRIKKDLIELLSIKRNHGIPGPKPKHPNKIEQRKQRLRDRTTTKAKQFQIAFAKLFLLGLLLPTTIFMAFLMEYHWFDPSGIAFISLHGGHPIQQTQLAQVVAFIADQLTHSLFLDVPEVFAFDVSPVTNNPSNVEFSSVVLLFRTIIGGFALFLLNSIRQSIVILWRLRAQDEDDVAKLESTQSA